jgi:hypothetical protein
MPVYKAVDPRTRGEKYFWHVPHGQPARRVNFDTATFSTGQKYDAEEQDTIRELESRSCIISLWQLDLFCGFLSLLALILTIPGVSRLFNWDIDNGLRWPMWHENVLCYNASFNATSLRRSSVDISSSLGIRQVFSSATNAGMQFAFNTTDAMTKQYCAAEQDKYSLPQIGRTWDDTRYECNVQAQQATGFDLWLALRLVFLISMAFQFGRAKLGQYPLDDSNAQIKWYNPYKPDIWRWWEYALTSSIQTAIIALSFFIGNREEVLCLAGLQAALCLLGFAIEKRISKLYKSKCKSLLASAQSQPNNPWRGEFKVGKLLILFISAWVFFGIIWFILLSRFDRQVRSSKDCDYKNNMPEAVYFIVIGEFVLFFLFGLAQLFHVYIALLQTSSADKAAELKQNSIRMWYYMAVVYSLLSIVAKTILEIGLLWLAKEAANML